MIKNLKLELKTGMTRSLNPRPLTEEQKASKRIKLKELEAEEEAHEALRREVVDGGTAIMGQATSHHQESMAQGISESNRIIEAVKHMTEPPAKKLKS